MTNLKSDVRTKDEDSGNLEMRVDREVGAAVLRRAFLHLAAAVALYFVLLAVAPWLYDRLQLSAAQIVRGWLHWSLFAAYVAAMIFFYLRDLLVFVAPGARRLAGYEVQTRAVRSAMESDGFAARWIGSKGERARWCRRLAAADDDEARRLVMRRPAWYWLLKGKAEKFAGKPESPWHEAPAGLIAAALLLPLLFMTVGIRPFMGQLDIYRNVAYTEAMPLRVTAGENRCVALEAQFIWSWARHQHLESSLVHRWFGLPVEEGHGREAKKALRQGLAKGYAWAVVAAAGSGGRVLPKSMREVLSVPACQSGKSAG